MSDTNALELRIEKLEEIARYHSSLVDLAKGPKGDTGREGRPGNIVAATEAAERVLDEKLASLFERVDLATKQVHQTHGELAKILRNEMDQFRKEMRQNFAAFEADIQNRVENSIVVLFEEYGVVSSHDNRPIQAGGE